MITRNRPMWRTSSYSTGSSNCVEVAVPAGAVAVRDTKDRGGPALAFSPPEWRAFLAEIKTGR